MILLRLIGIAVLAHMVFVSARMTASLYALSNNASTFTVGVIMALFSLVPMLISLRAGRWLDAVGPWRPTLIGALLVLGGALLPPMFSYAAADLSPLLVSATLFCAAIAFVLFPLFSSGIPLMAIAFLLGLGLGAAQPNIMSLVHSRAPEGRVGEVLGVRSTIIHSNQVFLPLVFGAFGTALGAAAMFWMMAALVLAGGMGAVHWNKHRR